MSDALVIRGDDAGITTLFLNRPGARHALSSALIAALRAELAAIAADRSVRCVVLAAEGPAFCAGHDLKEMRANPEPAFIDRLFQDCSALMQALIKLPQPVIARIQGVATAAGCQLVASCDLAIAAASAKFATPGVNIGLFCSTPMVALSRNVPRKRAMEMLLLGEMVSAAEAADWGLINRAVPDAELDAVTYDWARRIVEKSPLTLSIGKEAFYRQIERPVADAYDYASAVMARNMATADAQNGIDAFLAKRTPVWCGA